MEKDIEEVKEFHLVDSTLRILWIGSFDECLELKRILIANPENVSEEDEVKWESVLRTVEFIEPLEIHQV